MRFAIEGWAPEYGAVASDAVQLAETEAQVAVDAEVPVADWSPRTPPPSAGAEGVLWFVDGVRRVDARLWVTVDGDTRAGFCATYAAGAVRCDGSARLALAEVRRALFAPVPRLEAVATRHGRYRPVPVADDAPDQLSLSLQHELAELECRVGDQATEAASDGQLVLVDGPLRQRHRTAGTIGYVKTHHRSYLPEPVRPVVAALAAGQRTPVFQIGGAWSRWSWYQRLPVAIAHDWAGIVRCEASLELPIDRVGGLADRVAAVLPRFASAPQKDPRAPQNLYPIAGLERELRRRLGDARLLERALRQAAAEAAA